MTSTFDAGFTGAVRTPVFDAQAPATPAVGRGTADHFEQSEADTSGLAMPVTPADMEDEQHEQSEWVGESPPPVFHQIKEELTLHPAAIREKGLVETDSSSFSDSESASEQERLVRQNATKGTFSCLQSEVE